MSSNLGGVPPPPLNRRQQQYRIVDVIVRLCYQLFLCSCEVMKMVSGTASCMSLRLLVNKQSRKILYAEAGKDFVDLLFSFLTLPTGSVIKLLSALKQAKTIGCLTNLYDSVDKLQTMFMISEKSDLLEPKVIPNLSNKILRIQSADSAPTPTVYYVCRYLHNGGTHYMTSQRGGMCSCGNTTKDQVQLQNPSMGDRTDAVGVSGSGSGRGGYVKETVTFIITDDLEISPASTITSINLLNKLNVKDLSDLAERNASVGPDEALQLLWASLVSTTPLNDVFRAAVST